LKKTLLVVGGAIETVPGILRAQNMDLRVVVSDMNPLAPGCIAADEYLVASTYDVEKTVAAAVQYNKNKHTIDGVICIATDVPHTVAHVSAELGLPGISLETARLVTDKLAMKQRFRTDGVPVPWFRPVDSARDLEACAISNDIPLIIKPVDSRGARGVLRVIPDFDLRWGFEEARSQSPSGRIIVEQYLGGPQVSTESLVVDGEVFTVGFSDRNYEFLERFAPNVIENGGELPSFLPADIQNQVKNVVARAVQSLGIKNGVAKGDIVIHNGDVYVIEMAARLSGGYFCTHEIPLNTGVDFVGAAIRMALGEKIDSKDLMPTLNQGVAQRYFFPQPGKVVSIKGVKEVQARPEVALFEIRVKPGDIIGPVNSHPARAGVVIATGTDREDALINVKKAVHDIHIITQPE
jgi:biotin carboxylase